MSDRKQKTAYPRILLAAGASGSGKTTLTCGLLQALKNRGLRIASFKCGPDYIDPMFHEQVLHTRSRNLDTFFTDEDTTRYLFAMNAADMDVSVMEGVMGYYDGLGGISDTASAYHLAGVTRTPVVLIVNSRGMSLSALAYIRGFITYREDSHIQGVILNQMPAALYPDMKKHIEEELGVRVFGYVPRMADCAIKSRHLGLVMPHEVELLEEKMQRMASVMEETLDIDGLLELAKDAELLPWEGKRMHEAEKPCNASAQETSAKETPAREALVQKTQSWNSTSINMHGMPEKLRAILEGPEAQKIRSAEPVIAVARDEAFCFIYENNLHLLRALGARLVEFSPLRDKAVPQEANGLLLYGGYPELFAEQLSKNESMLRDIREKIRAGMPCLAECGGFLYLHKTLEDMDGKTWPVAGVLDARAFRTEKLARFGYVELEPAEEEQEVLCTEQHGGIEQSSNAEQSTDTKQRHGIEQSTDIEQSSRKLHGHEFHYFDSTDSGSSYIARKPLRKRSWKCIHKKGRLLAGFPHLYYYSDPQFAVEFCEKCVDYGKERV